MSCVGVFTKDMDMQKQLQDKFPTNAQHPAADVCVATRASQDS